LRLIEANERTITGKGNPYRGIAKAYQRIYKVYEGILEIDNTEELRRFSAQCDNILEMQEAFINTIHSETAPDCEKNLRRETDVQKIRLVVGLN